MLDYASGIKLEVTPELCDSPSQLGDGTETTWGEATDAQDQQYIEMMLPKGQGVFETAARHQAAINLRKETGVVCLNDLLARKAA